MSLLRSITDQGVEFATSKSEKRNVKLSNYISLVISVANVFLLFARMFFYPEIILLVQAFLPGLFIFLLPILLNRMGLIRLSRIVICWTPSLIVVSGAVNMMSASVFESSTFVGVRYLLIALTCVPLVVFNLRDRRLFLTGLSVPLLLLILFDPILTLFNVGYVQVGLNDEAYYFNNFRAAASVFIVTSVIVMLKILIERSEKLNEELIIDLDEKNKLIQAQRKTEILKLNAELTDNLSKLTEREFILSESQRIAHIGSWDYNWETDNIFWSDEMFNIFGIDKNYKVDRYSFSNLLAEEHRVIVNEAFRKIRSHGESFDFTVQALTPLRQLRWMRICAFPVMNGKHVTGARGICHDVSFYKEAEEQLRLNEMRYRSLFEDSSIGMTMVAPSGYWLKVNPAFCQIVGYTEAELQNMTFQQMTIPEDLAQDVIHMEKFTNGEVDTMRLQKRFYHKGGHIVWVNINVSMIRDNSGKSLYFIAQIEDITGLKTVEKEKERARYQLNERVKELTTMYRTSQTLSDEQSPIDVTMHQISNILPEGWQFPPVTVSCIAIDGRKYFSHNYEDPAHVQRATFTTSYGAEGCVEVGYTDKELPQEVEGPFLAEERNLISVIAEMIRVFLDRKHEAEELSRWEANLMATINNTETLIWSVDRDLKLITFNAPFSQHVKKQYGVDARVGQAQYEIKVDADISGHWKGLTEKWIGFFQRALSGEKFTTEEFNVGKFFRYSLSPIVVHEEIIGVSVFANDITEQKEHEHEMIEMNKKIGELKLMALRSVMNPHFIFNVLNSIQYFIAKNDRVNAINYLSTFSKLIRSILTHSTGNKIKLQDEIDMLKNYVDLEQTRFEDKFTFTLNVDDSVEADSVEIPSLLIQPYVENAILHGLYNKIGSGALVINVKDENESILFEIIDDGIGRVAAHKLKEKNMPGHKSMGIKITEERLKLINEHHNVSFEIDDRYDSNGDGAGTTIRVWIRY